MVLVTKSCLTLVTPWTVAHQAHLFMRFPRQESWSELPFPSSGIFTTQGSSLGLVFQADSLLTEPSEKPK